MIRMFVTLIGFLAMCYGAVNVALIHISEAQWHDTQEKFYISLVVGALLFIVGGLSQLRRKPQQKDNRIISIHRR